MAIGKNAGNGNVGGNRKGQTRRSNVEGSGDSRQAPRGASSNQDGVDERPAFNRLFVLFRILAKLFFAKDARDPSYDEAAQKAAYGEAKALWMSLTQRSANGFLSKATRAFLRVAFNDGKVPEKDSRESVEAFGALNAAGRGNQIRGLILQAAAIVAIFSGKEKPAKLAILKRMLAANTTSRKDERDVVNGVVKTVEFKRDDETRRDIVFLYGYPAQLAILPFLDEEVEAGNEEAKKVASSIRVGQARSTANSVVKDLLSDLLGDGGDTATDDLLGGAASGEVSGS